MADSTNGPNTPVDAVRETLTAHLQELNKPGVLSVRPGWEYVSGWLTGRRAIVATVERKTSLDELAAADRLPDQIDGVPIDVRQASARKRLELTDPARYASQLRLSPDLGSVPHFADETSPTGAAVGVGASAHTAFAALTAAKPRLPYSPPPGASLAPVTDTVTIHLARQPGCRVDDARAVPRRRHHRPDHRSVRLHLTTRAGRRQRRARRQGTEADPRPSGHQPHRRPD